MSEPIYTKQDARKKYNRLREELGEQPSRLQFASYPYGVSIGVVRRLYDKWNDLVRDCGDEPIKAGKFSEEYLLRKLSEYIEENGFPKVKDINASDNLPSYAPYHTHFGGLTEAIRAAGYDEFEPRVKRYTDEEIVKSIKSFATDLGRTPTGIEVNKEPSVPTKATIYKRLNMSYNEFCREIGLVPWKEGTSKSNMSPKERERRKVTSATFHD